MLTILFIVITLVVLLFGFVVFFGAPYLPTFRTHANIALDMLDLKPKETLLELGCGDGRVLELAAERGLKAVGYELNPLLAVIARCRTWRYRRQVRVVWGNFWRKKWPKTDGIYVFLLDKYMERLNNKIIQQYEGRSVKLASFTFRIPSKTPAKQRRGIYLYTY